MNDMTVNAPASLSGTMNVDEFMAFLETRPKGEHWDLVEGVAVMMSPAGLVHQQVASNFRDLLNAAFAAKDLDLYAFGDIGVRIPGVMDFQPEPDVAVVPGMRDGYYAEQFLLAAEVLSPSNTRKLIDTKLRLYCKALTISMRSRSSRENSGWKSTQRAASGIRPSSSAPTM